MAQRTWIGGATPSVGQVWKGTITTTTGTHTYTVTLTLENGATVAITYTVTGSEGSVTAVALAFITAWNLSQLPGISGITATQSAGQVILTADTEGTPFSAAASGSGTWSGTGNTTENVGPTDYGTAANWAEGAIPVANDDVKITGTYSILYGLQRASVELDDVIIDSHSGQVGGPAGMLTLDMADADRCEINSSGETWLSLGSAACSPRIIATKSPSSGKAGLYLYGTALATLTVESGNVRILSGSTVVTLAVRPGASVVVESGVTLTTIHNAGGVVSHSAATTVNNVSGTCTIHGAVTTINCESGTVQQTTGNVTTANCDGGVVDTTLSRIARTYGTVNANGGEFRHDPNVVTLTNPPASTGTLSTKRVAA